MIDFDARSLNQSAKYDENSVYPKIEGGFAFIPHMNAVYVKSFNDGTFNQDDNQSAMLKTKYYNQPKLIFQHLPSKEKLKNLELNRVDTLTSVDIQETVKIEIGRTVIPNYEAVIHRENFRKSPFGKVEEKLFAVRQEDKDERNDLMQCLVNLIVNSLF